MLFVLFTQIWDTYEQKKNWDTFVCTVVSSLSTPPLQRKALCPLPCVSNTSLCLPHLLGLNELGGLIMILLTAENSTERFTSSVCMGDKPKTDVHMLSLVITENAALMWTCCQPSCLQSLPKIPWCVYNANWCVCTGCRFYHTWCCTWHVSWVLADQWGL